MASKRTRPRHSAENIDGQPMNSFCEWHADTLVLNILGQPNANRDAIGKPKGKQLQVSVTQAKGARDI